MSTIFSRPFDHVFLVLRVVVFAQFEREQDIFGHRQRIEQGAGLENHGHLARMRLHLGLGEVGDVFVRHDDPALVGLAESP